MKLNFVFKLSRLMIALTINISKTISFTTFCTKGTGQFVVGDEKTSATVVLNNNLWLEIDTNTRSSVTGLAVFNPLITTMNSLFYR